MEQLDPQLRALLSEHRADGRMPQDRRDAAWERLQRSIAEEDRSVQAGPIGHARRGMSDGTVVRPPAASRAGRRWLRDATITALLAAAAVLLIVSLKAAVGRPTRTDGASQAVHGAGEPDERPVRATRPEPARAGAAVPTEPQSPLPAIPTAAPDPAPRAVRPTAPPADELAAELALLRRARAALTGGAPADALPLLDEFERRFGAGHLAEEGALLRVQALCDSGARARARAAADQFTRRFPDSPHAPTAARTCADDLR